MLPLTFVVLLLICCVNCYNEVIGEETMEKIRDMFPYCRIGEDQDGAGVYFSPFAAWKFQELATNGTPLEKETFELHLDEIIGGYYLDGGRKGKGITFILDCAGLDLNDLLAPEALEISMKLYAKSGANARAAKQFVIINMGLPTQLFRAIWNPLLGGLRPITRMFGTNPAEWVPHLRDSIPNDVLLQGYGGTNPMPPNCDRGETRQPFRFPSVDTLISAISFIAQNSWKLMSAGAISLPRAIGNVPPVSTKCSISRCIWLNECI